ncbi:MAG: N-acetylmuramoyl-L-alanine amidase [Flavobacteriia bacterium]|nr:N-acetylmuramoyl-L-alanine amidase [Flavobacteriia bacterium]
MKHLAVFAVLSLFGSAFALSESQKIHLVIDPGHGGKDPGHPVENVYESDINLKWAMELKEAAEERGIEVTLTREEDEFVDLSTRAEIADAVEGENVILISLHQSASDNANASGTRLYTLAEADEETKSLAEIIKAHLDTIHETRLEEGDFYMLRNRLYPAIMISAGFMSNSDNLELLQSEDFRAQFNDQLLNALVKE